MLTASYICVGLSVFSLFLVIRIIQKKERRRVFRYNGITDKRKRMIFKI